MIKFTYDPEADAAYVKISDATIAETKEIMDDVNFDLDKSGKCVGIEILSVKDRGAGVKDTVTAETTG